MANSASRGLAALFAVATAATIAVAPAFVPAFADEAKIGDLVLDHPYSRATPPNARTGAGYTTIHNNGAQNDRLVSVSCDCAEAAEIHEMKMDGNVMRMRQLPDGLPIPAGSTVVLEPGSYHLMFIGLNAPFKQGDTVEATLTFEKAGSVDALFEVKPLGGIKGDGMKGHDQMKHGEHKSN